MIRVTTPDEARAERGLKIATDIGRVYYGMDFEVEAFGTSLADALADMLHAGVITYQDLRLAADRAENYYRSEAS